MTIIKEYLRPKALYPVYPPYHTGEYQEEYFYKRWNEDKPQCERKYIDIFWTNLYCNTSHSGYDIPNIQKELYDNLDWNDKYFTICQHDDGPFEILPPDTLVFVSGGNKKFEKKVALPSICSPLNINPNNNIKSKRYLASFVGSLTHQIRYKMIDACKHRTDIKMYVKNWNPIVNKNEFLTFIDLTLDSKFCLCPRGYGQSSFRMYEAMQLGSIPVYISDTPYLPFSDELNYEDFCVILSEKDLSNIGEILENYSDDKIEMMTIKMKEVWNKYFSLEGMYQQIIKRLK